MRTRTFYILLLIAVAGFTVWSLHDTGFDPGKIYDGFFRKPFFGQFIAGLWPLNWEIFGEVLQQTLITIQVAWIGTLIAAIIALPISFAAARNITPALPIGSLCRFFFNVDRAIDVVIVALILVSALGFGPLAGIIAIALHSIGSIGKLFTEAIEEIDHGPVEALESTGASRLQVVRWGVVPQVLPYLVGYFLYRLELNIRSAVVLGVVGAGGVGVMLMNNIKQFQYHNVSMILLVIVVLVMSIDFISGKLRRGAG
jgi:phosphonate ABC transporter permease subunit PhnE